MKSWKAELSTVVRISTFVSANEAINESLISLKMKKNKLKIIYYHQNPKSRCCLIGGYQQDLYGYCIYLLSLNFLNLNDFFTTMSEWKNRIYQLDFVDTFLQSSFSMWILPSYPKNDQIWCLDLLNSFEGLEDYPRRCMVI